MKTIFALCAVVLIVAVVIIFRATRMPNKYGDFIGAPEAQVADVIVKPQDFLHKNLLLNGVVRNQCTTMGCYFFFYEGKKMLRVDLQAIAMNAPRKNGHRVRVEGQLVPFDGGYQFAASAVEFE